MDNVFTDEEVQDAAIFDEQGMPKDYCPDCGEEMESNYYMVSEDDWGADWKCHNCGFEGNK